MRIVDTATAVLLSISVSPAAGDPFTEGLASYAAGDFAAAVKSFRAALEADPDNPRLNYNLALALWRSGDGDGAEVAAEKSAAAGGGVFTGLRDSILGSVRYDGARKAASSKIDPGKEVEVLTSAVEKVGLARKHFQRGAIALSAHRSEAATEVVRNLERAIKLEEELKKRLEEARKKQEEQQKKDDKNKKDDPNKDEKKTEDPNQDQKDKDDQKDGKDKDDKKDENKKDEADKDKQDQKKDEQQKQKPDQGDKDPREEQPEPEPKKDDEKKDGKKKKPPSPNPEKEKPSKPHEAPKPMAAPGEHDPNKELTPEQRRAVLKRLAEAEANLKKLKQASKASRPKVKKDW